MHVNERHYQVRKPYICREERSDSCRRDGTRAAFETYRVVMLHTTHINRCAKCAWLTGFNTEVWWIPQWWRRIQHLTKQSLEKILRHAAKLRISSICLALVLTKESSLYKIIKFLCTTLVCVCCFTFSVLVNFNYVNAKCDVYILKPTVYHAVNEILSHDKSKKKM